MAAYWDALTGEVSGIEFTFYFSPTDFGPWSLIKELGDPSSVVFSAPDPGNPDLVRLRLLYSNRGALFQFYGSPDRRGRLCNWGFHLNEVLIAPIDEDPTALAQALEWVPPRSRTNDQPSLLSNLTPESLNSFLADPLQCVPLHPTAQP